jgi:transcriptional regulator with XRE-family HTH domain
MGMKQNQAAFNSVGQNIRSLRIQSGWSLRDAAYRLGISTSALSKIETGVTDVNLSRLEQIAEIYRVNLVQLWVLDFESSQIQATNLNVAKKKVSDLELEIANFQRKVIVLYEKLRQQTTTLQPVHS